MRGTTAFVRRYFRHDEELTWFKCVSCRIVWSTVSLTRSPRYCPHCGRRRVKWIDPVRKPYHHLPPAPTLEWELQRRWVSFMPCIQGEKMWLTLRTVGDNSRTGLPSARKAYADLVQARDWEDADSEGDPDYAYRLKLVSHPPKLPA